MRKPPFSFTILLLLMGGMLAIFVAVDLGGRGFRQFPPETLWEVEGGEVEKGRLAIHRYGCGGCHVIPGIRAATGRVGPQLRDFRNQIYIAGVLPNIPENLVAWIENPKHFNPITAMPNLQVTPQEARDIAAYLYANP
jgi:cytochrome c